MINTSTKTCEAKDMGRKKKRVYKAADKLTEALKDEFIRLSEKGMHGTEILETEPFAKYGITPYHVTRAKKNDPDFYDAVLNAKKLYQHELAEAVFLACLNDKNAKYRDRLRAAEYLAKQASTMHPSLAGTINKEHGIYEPKTQISLDGTTEIHDFDVSIRTKKTGDAPVREEDIVDFFDEDEE